MWLRVSKNPVLGSPIVPAFGFWFSEFSPTSFFRCRSFPTTVSNSSSFKMVPRLIKIVVARRQFAISNVEAVKIFTAAALVVTAKNSSDASIEEQRLSS